MASTTQDPIQPDEKAPQDVYTVLADGTKTNAPMMEDLLSDSAPETPAEFRARKKHYMREFGITAEEFQRFYA